MIDLLTIQLQEAYQKLNKGRFIDLKIYTESLFMLEFMAFPLSSKFKIPSIGSYGDTKDPLQHLENVKGWMDLYAYNNTIKC